MYKFIDFEILIFTKAPILGSVKTRMQSSFSQQFSFELHCALVDYCLTKIVDAKICPIQFWLAGDENIFREHFAQWSDLNIYQQVGKDLGQRMYSACRQSLADSNGVILMGTDCVEIDQDYLTQACEALANNDIVIGPAKDGGYVLLGLKQPYMNLFEDIDWGEESVFSQTMEKIKSLNLSFLQLPILSDVDRPDDLNGLKNIAVFNDLFQRYKVDLNQI
jgi:rSAM/selenodomain-associated transferase 1